MGEAQLAAGKIEAAVSCANRALDIALLNEARGHQAWAHFLLGSAVQAARRGTGAQSIEALEAALRLAQACDARPLVGLSNAALSRVRQARGVGAAARQFAAAANAILAELDMNPLPMA
jgi:hypothetical protein